MVKNVMKRQKKT